MKMLHITDVDVDDVIYIPTNEGFVGGRVFKITYIGDEKYNIELINKDEIFTIGSDNFVIYDDN